MKSAAIYVFSIAHYCIALIANHGIDLLLWGVSSIIGMMDGRKTLRVGQSLLKVVASALGAFVGSLVTLLAESAKTSDPRNASDTVPSGGVLNYRTGKLDDGTDPVGWYEKD